MAVREPVMFFYGRGQSRYELTPNFGEGIVIKKIYVPEAVSDFLKIYIQKTLVGYWNIGTEPIGNNLYLVDSTYNQGAGGGGGASVENVYNYLVERGLFRPYRVAEGETIYFETENNTPFTLILEYETHDATDIDPAEPNGSKSDEYDFVHYITPSTIEALENTYDTSNNPPEFPAFPAAERVPAEVEIDIKGILGLPWTYDDGTNIMRSRAIKIVYNRKVLFDEEKHGIPFAGKYYTSAGGGGFVGGVFDTVIRAHSHKDQMPLYLFPEPLSFQPGDELEVRLVTEVLAGDLTAIIGTNGMIGLLETVRPAR